MYKKGDRVEEIVRPGFMSEEIQQFFWDRSEKGIPSFEGVIYRISRVNEYGTTYISGYCVAFEEGKVQHFAPSSIRRIGRCSKEEMLTHWHSEIREVGLKCITL